MSAAHLCLVTVDANSSNSDEAMSMCVELGAEVDVPAAAGSYPMAAAVGVGRFWAPEEYAPFVAAEGARKLSASAVAPLVAAARGFETLTWVDPRTTGQECKRLDINRRNKQGRRFAESLQAGDILVMPWYLPDVVDRAEAAGVSPKVTSVQFRPAVPERGETGRERKYEFVLGSETILGAHPGTPGSWFRDPRVPLLIAEGQLKGDSAITGSLIAAGVTSEQLRLHDGESVLTAQQRLRSLWLSVPEADRVCVIAIAGVWNFRKNAEWTMVELDGRDVWVAVDGDVATKWQVWDATSQLFKLLSLRRANTSLLAPTVTTPDGGAKVGVDDYLADWGTWTDLLGQLSPELPKQPHRDNVEYVNTHRISPEGTALQFCRPRVDEATGDVIGGTWIETFPIGGRVIAQTVQRKPTSEENRTGRFGDGLGRLPPGTDERVEIEVCWLDPAGNTVTEVVEGPTDILIESVDRWIHQKPIMIPTPLKLHPAWPPRGQDSQNWLSAVKANRETEVQHRTLWTRMGWVPVPNDIPVFSIGEQVIGEKVEGTTQSAVGDLIQNSELFGVGDDDGADFADPGYRRQLARDLKATIDAVLAAYMQRSAAAVVLSAGVRAALPLQSNAVVYLVGPPGSGKSFSAGAICGFWSRHPGDWDGDSLPGSAKDSIARTEANLSVACMWVVDDLAPSSDPRKAVREQSDLDDTIRMVHNGSSRGRMTKDGTPRDVRIPNALLVATAENESPVESIRQRSLTLWFRKGSLPPSRKPTDALVDLYQYDGAPARVTQGLIKLIRHRAEVTHGGEWKHVVDEVSSFRSEACDLVRQRMEDAGFVGGSTTRAIRIGGDLVLALAYLGQLADELGLDPSYSELLAGDGGLPDDLTGLVVSNWSDSAKSTPGRNLLSAISLALRSGRAHVQSASGPMDVPGNGNAQLASQLGWGLHGDKLAPNGPAIGIYGTVQDSDEEIVLLDHLNAFGVAQRHYPDLLPAGTRPASSWQSARDDHLLQDLGPTSKGVTTRRRLKGAEQRYSGVPVSIENLVSPSWDTPAAETPHSPATLRLAHPQPGNHPDEGSVVTSPESDAAAHVTPGAVTSR